MNALRVALDVSLLERPEPTGVERGLTTLRDALLAHGAPLELVPVAAPPSLPVALWRETTLPRLLAGLRIDVYHSPVAAVPLRAGCPVVATLHELPWASDDPAARAAGDGRWTHRARTALAASVAARLVCVSERTRRHFVARHPEAASRAVVIPHAVDGRFQPAAPGSEDAVVDAALRARLGIAMGAGVRAGIGAEGRAGMGANGRAPFVLAVGRLRRKKNLATLLDAFAAAPAAAGLSLVLAGPDGDGSDALAARARRADLAGRVLFPGAVDDRTLLALYRGATLLAFPSLFEGFGLPVLEAMACGTAVVASEEGAAPEVRGDAVATCRAHDPASLAAALQDVLSSPARRAELIARGARHVARFDAASLARAHVAVYAACLPSRAPDAAR
jgi:glycosyltransferase involved in cell wall biosynthesis